MDRDINYFKDKLLKEKEKLISIIYRLEEGKDNEFSSELSLYDNHTGDAGSELFDKERNLALKRNEYKIFDEINKSLEKINNGSYGICDSCSGEINDERLDFIPYTKYCVTCQKEIDKKRERTMEDRPQEENVIAPNFNYDYDEFYSDDVSYTEDIEKISNEDYKRGLPD
ncbi:MAG: TraR/DksA C4-type zinc finger protein [Clostridiaceae bacterium]